MSNGLQSLSIATLTLLGLSLFSAGSLAQTVQLKDCLPLTPKDHTSVIRAIQGKIDNVTALARKERLDVLARSPQTSQALLNTISKSGILDGNTNRKLDLAASCLSLALVSSIQPNSRAAIQRVAQEFERASNVQTLIDRIATLQKEFPNLNDVQEALKVATSVLRDGQTTIYNEKEQVFQAMSASSAEQPLTKAKGAGEHAVDLAAADGKGVVNGAVGGCVAGLLAAGVGCGPGAIAGGVAAGIGNSAQELVETAWRHAK